jgi:uncharacterized protein
VAIWIGAPEANAIAVALHGHAAERPLTHDLLASAVAAVGGRVTRVVVTRVTDGTYFAEVHLARLDGESTILDARPSDAIATALRTSAPLLVAESLWQARDGAQPAMPEPLSDAALRAHLRRLGPEDFGRFLP